MSRRKRIEGVNQATRWTHEQIMERASKLFGPKFTPSGAGKYTAEELRITLNDLLKNSPPKEEGAHIDKEN